MTKKKKHSAFHKHNHFIVVFLLFLSFLAMLGFFLYPAKRDIQASRESTMSVLGTSTRHR